jgi:GntR family transcriptional repressor for pyruvate dehydrogenase complex
MITFQDFDGSSPEYCFDVRVGLEGEAAAAAACNRDYRDIGRLARIIERLECLDQRREIGLEEDFDFHLQVARSSHNHYFTSALLSLKKHIADSILLARTISQMDPKDKAVAINRQHRRIFEAIVAGDDEGARQAMKDHLSRCKKSTSHWHTQENKVAVIP